MTEIILTSSVLIALLVILRRVLRGRISPCAQYALWLLVAARLLIPGTLFTAPVSVLGAASEVQESLYEAFPSQQPEQPSQPMIQHIQLPGQPDSPPTTVYGMLTTMPSPKGEYHLLDILWWAGMAVTGSTMVLSNLVFCLRLRKRRKPLSLPASCWAGGLPVYEADGLPSPCLSGFFRPAIYLNEAALKTEHPEHILAHEYAHYRHGDHIWSILRSICLVIHWYNPLVWWAAVLSRRDCELACDAAALRRLGEEARIDYGQTLLAMVSKKASPVTLLHTATTMTAGKRAMTERVAFIIRQPRTRKVTLALVTVLACLLAACSFGGTAGDGTPSSAPEDAALLEFPGLHWNDSVETVMETLGVTEEDFIESGGSDTSDTSDIFSFIVGDIPFFGYTAQYVTCRFVQYSGNELGLYQVEVSFPDDMEDFGGVQEELSRQYGPASGESTNVWPINTSWRRILGDRYDSWVELQQKPGVNTVFWSLGEDAVPEGSVGPIETAYANWSALHAEDTFEDFLEELPIGKLTWCSNSSMWTPTFNTVTFDGGGYVLCLQMSSGGAGTAGD